MTSPQPLLDWLLREPNSEQRPTIEPATPPVRDALPRGSLDADPAQLPVPQPTRVLVVDDDAGVRRLAELSLQEAGFTVTTATNGEEALAALTEARPDAVLLDLEMPVMDGREFLARLRELDPELPVVIMTGHRALEARMELPAQDAIQKPFDPWLLAGRVARAVAASRAR